jgi:hypothetical protein
MRQPQVVVYLGEDQQLYFLRRVPAEDLRDLLLESSPVAVHIITWTLRPWVKVNGGSWGNSSFLSRLRDVKMLVTPQSSSALTHCMLLCMFCTRTSWTICAESGLSVPYRYWIDVRARPSRMTLDFTAIVCGCIWSKVGNSAWFPKFSITNSVRSSLSRRVTYREW